MLRMIKTLNPLGKHRKLLNEKLNKYKYKKCTDSN